MDTGHFTSPDVWNFVVAILVGAGYREIAARAIIGRKLKEYADGTVIEAFEAAAGKADPVGYATKILSTKPKRKPPQNALQLAEQVAPVNQTESGIRNGLELCKEKLK